MSADVTAHWLDELYGSRSLDELYLTLCWRADGRIASRHVQVERVHEAVTMLGQLAASTCTWVGCNPLTTKPERGRGGGNLAGAVVGMWADIDVAGPGHKRPDNGLPLPADRDAAWDLLGTVALAPTAVIDSGGGLQAWWLMWEPWLLESKAERAEADAVVKAWGQTMVELGRRAGVHVDNVGDLARILRPAGTWNRKAGRTPAPVSLVLSGGPRYELSDLTGALLPVEQPAQQPTTRSQPHCSQSGRVYDLSGSPYARPMSPADVFARHVTWADLLQPHGWQRFIDSRGNPALGGPCKRCGQRVELWSHPFVELDVNGNPDHPSATCCHVLYSFSLNEQSTKPVPKLTPLTPFRVWALLDHGGDMSAAARLILRTAQQMSGES
jgi:hypothetical protein